MRSFHGPCYLVARGWVHASDLTPDEAAALAPVFALRLDSALLSADAFVALCGALGLDVFHAAGRLLARWRGRRSA